MEVVLLTTNAITSNNFCNSVADLRVGYSHPQEVPSMHSHHNQYYTVFPSCSQFFFSSLRPARSASSWQEIIFIYFCVISYEFVSASLRKPCVFFPMIFDGDPTHFIPDTSKFYLDHPTVLLKYESNKVL